MLRHPSELQTDLFFLINCALSPLKNICVQTLEQGFHFLPCCLLRELNLQKGDIVYIHRQVDANWFEGEHHGRAGIFPTTYVEVRFFI